MPDDRVMKRAQMSDASKLDAKLNPAASHLGSLP